VSADRREATQARELLSAAALRREFDAAFAAPPETTEAATEDMLAVRVGPDPFVLRLAEIAGLHADFTIVPVPSSAASLIGIVGIRGALKPVHDLAVLLGYGAAGSPRWLIFPQAAPAIGLAFATLESHLKVRKDSLQAERADDMRPAASRGFTRGLVLVEDAPRPIIHLQSLVRVIKDEVP
jgi:purine-binding chemotaxis protein CheW